MGSWFNFNNLGLALGVALKFYTSLAKGLRLKVIKFFRLIPMFIEVIGEKLVRGLFAPTPILNRVKLTYNVVNELCGYKLIYGIVNLWI